MKVRFLCSEDVKKALPMEKAIDVMAEAFSQFSSGRAQVPLRNRVKTKKGETLFMPAYLMDTGAVAIKVVSVYPENIEHGLPTVPGIVLAIDSDTGIPRAIIEGYTLTAIRTGAAGGLAAKLLSLPNSENLVVFGAGTQGWAQICGVLAVRNIKRIWIFDPNEKNKENLALKLKSLPSPPDVIIFDDPNKAVSRAHIIVTATTSTTPVFDGSYVRPGTHVTAVGSYTPNMQEIDGKLMQQAKVVVDSREACLAETGDIIKPKVSIYAEIGEIVSKKSLGRTSDEEITIFKTVGIAVQDAAAAKAIVEYAEQKNLGELMELT